MDRLTALIDRAEEQGCVNLSQFSELLHELDLDEDELARVYEQLEERGIELSDDCGHVREDEATYGVRRFCITRCHRQVSSRCAAILRSMAVDSTDATCVTAFAALAACWRAVA